MDVLKRMTEETNPIRAMRQPDGSSIYVRELEYDTIEEPWARYVLKDGGKIRQRVVTSRIFEVYAKAEDGSFVPVKTIHGDKQILTESINQTVCSG